MNDDSFSVEQTSSLLRLLNIATAYQKQTGSLLYLILRSL